MSKSRTKVISQKHIRNIPRISNTIGGGMLSSASLTNLMPSQNEKDTESVISDRRQKRYCFNVEDSSCVKVGDRIKTDAYTTNLVVVEILEKSYKYYNSNTGELTDKIKSTANYAIVTLKIVDASDSKTVVGSILVD